jgi:hypothetical protein
MSWDLLVRHTGRQNRLMGSGGLAVETDKTMEISGGTPCVNHLADPMVDGRSANEKAEDPQSEQSPLLLAVVQSVGNGNGASSSLAHVPTQAT